MKLQSKRLAAVASLVRQGVVFADVGTDHAYIPAYLVANGICRHGYAGDLRKGPLGIAADNLLEYNVSDKVDLVLCDGMSGFPINKIDDIIIAGMGGDTVIGIIDAENRIRKEHHLILQPMTNVPKVRSYLFSNGFVIEDELLCAEDGKIYNILLAVKKETVSPSFKDIWFGTHIDSSPLKFEYIEYLLIKHRKHLEGLQRASIPQADEITLEKSIIRMLEEIK